MTRSKLKANYDYQHVLSDLLEQVVLTYQKTSTNDHVSLAQVEAALSINPLKIRKLLITARVC